MSLTSLLNVARGALLTHERVVAVTANNIANAETPGYSRQRAKLSAAQPEPAPPFGQVGRGVELVSIERMRSGFFDANWRREAGVGGRLQTLRDTLQQVSGIIGEPSDTGVSAGLDSLIDAFQTLASNPVDPAARAVVIANATSLADKFHSIDSRLENVAANIGAELSQVVGEANALIHELSSLNGQIVQANGQAPDLLDRRDIAIDKLSAYLDVRVLEHGQGTVDVLLGGLQLVTSGGGTQDLSVSGGGPFQLQLGNPPVPVSSASGKLKGLFDAAAALGTRGTPASRATGLRGQLDDLALAIVSAVNQIHSNYDPTTKLLQPTLTPAPAPLATIGAFFDPAGVTAASISLNGAIAANPAQLATGWSTAPGDNSIAFRLGELRSLKVPIPGATAATPNSPAVAAGPPATLGEYFTGLVAGLGVATQDAENGAAAQSTLTDHLEAQRQDVAGVNIDEEMVHLIEHQHAYAAAARLIQAVDEMLRELINLGR